jgi:hypothetical protein
MQLFMFSSFAGISPSPAAAMCLSVGWKISFPKCFVWIINVYYRPLFARLFVSVRVACLSIISPSVARRTRPDKGEKRKFIIRSGATRLRKWQRKQTKRKFLVKFQFSAMKLKLFCSKLIMPMRIGYLDSRERRDEEPLYVLPSARRALRCPFTCNAYI